MRGICFNGTKGLECGCNGWIIFDWCDGCIGCVVGRSGNRGCGCRLGRTGIFCVPITFIPTVVQIGIVVIVCVGWYRGGCNGCCSTGGRLGKEELIVFALGLFGEGFDRTSSSTAGKNSMV